jgi:hypothetical protein
LSATEDELDSALADLKKTKINAESLQQQLSETNGTELIILCSFDDKNLILLCVIRKT